MDPVGLGDIWDISYVANFMSDDNDFMNFRQFKRLNLYSTLRLQHKLIALDQQLGSSEKSRNFQGVDELLVQASKLLDEYGRALALQQQLLQLTPTPKHVVADIQEHARKHVPAISRELDPENGWEELCSLVTTQDGWLHRLVGSSSLLQMIFDKMLDNSGIQPQANMYKQWYDRGADGARKATSRLRKHFFVYSNQHVTRVEEAIVNLLFVSGLALPICALSYMHSKLGGILVVVCSLIITSFVTSYLVGPTQRAGLGLVAAYGAILVVFVGNGVSLN